MRAPSGQWADRGIRAAACGRNGAESRIRGRRRYGRIRRSLRRAMRRTYRLLQMVKSDRFQHTAIGFCALGVAGSGAIAFQSMWRISDQGTESALTTLGIACLIA